MVSWWNSASMLTHLVRYRDFVCIRLVIGVHFLCKELDLLLLEVAWAYQLCPVHSFLLIYVRANCSIWTSYVGSST